MATRKATKPPVAAAAAETTETVDTMAVLYTNSIGRIAEMQKIGIDLALRQSTDVIVAWKKIAQAIPGASSLFLLDLSESALVQFADTQKAAIDMILAQTRALAEVTRERAASASEAIENAPAIVRQTVEQSIAAQKKALDHSAAQSRAALENARENFGMAGTPVETVALSFQRGVDSLVESQKELLDFAAKPFTVVH